MWVLGIELGLSGLARVPLPTAPSFCSTAGNLSTVAHGCRPSTCETEGGGVPQAGVHLVYVVNSRPAGTHSKPWPEGVDNSKEQEYNAGLGHVVSVIRPRLPPLEGPGHAHAFTQREGPTMRVGIVVSGKTLESILTKGKGSGETSQVADYTQPWVHFPIHLVQA